MITSRINFFILFIALKFYFTIANSRISEIKCKEYERITQVPHYVRGHQSFPANIVTTDNCLHNSLALIVGAEDAFLDEFPHQAILGYQKGIKIQWNCGGSLVSPKFILTAMHCLDSKDTGPVKFVKLGMVNRSQIDERVKVYGIEELFKHENYDRITKNNDIALIKLNDTVHFDAHIYPICLPSKQHYGDAIITGFGTTGEYDASSENLLKASLQHFTHAQCQDLHPKTRIFLNTMMCYGHRILSRDACRGDSGGPLQIFNDNVAKCTYTQIGVVSFGPKTCGTIGIPGVYVNVYHYLDWIEGIVWKDEI